MARRNSDNFVGNFDQNKTGMSRVHNPEGAAFFLLTLPGLNIMITSTGDSIGP